MSVAQERAEGGEARPASEHEQEEPSGFIARRHRQVDHPRALIAGAIILGIAVGIRQMGAVQRYYGGAWFNSLTTDLVQWAFLASVTLLALEYLTGGLGLLWNEGRPVAGDGASTVSSRTIVLAAVGFGLLGVLIPPTLNQRLVNVIVASVALHMALVYMTSNEEPVPEPAPDPGSVWSGLVVDRVRSEGGQTTLRLKNASAGTSVAGTVDLRGVEIEDGHGNRHPLGGNVVLEKGRTEVFGFDADETFRPETGKPLLLHVDGEERTILWEPPEG
jgi:hypothetical protein